MQINYLKHQTLRFPIIQSDITNHCNLRCKFCLTDFSNPAPRQNMEKQVFQKSLQLLPLADDNAFHFSCAFEPMLHPDFLELLEMFPAKSRSKVLFTTNLSKELSDEDVRRMANTNVDHINISLETFDPDLYTHLTGAKKSYILENLERIAEIFPTVKNAPRLCFITMVLKDNCDEVFSIAQKVNDRYFPSYHVFRTPYNFHVKNAYNEANLLPRDYLDDLDRRLKAAFPHARTEFGTDEVSYFTTNTNNNRDFFHFNEHYLVTVNLDGTGEIRADHSAFDLNRIEDIPAHFERERIRLQELQCARTPRVELDAPAAAKDAGGMQLNQLILYDNRFLCLNATIPRTVKDTAEFYWDILVNKRRYCFQSNLVQSADPDHFVIESLIDLKALDIEKIRSLSVSVAVEEGGEVRTHLLMKELTRFPFIKRALRKVRRLLRS